MAAPDDAPSKPYRFLLRMPEELRAELAATSGRDGRSLNAEIVRRLERSLAEERRAVEQTSARAILRRRLVGLAAGAGAVAAAAIAIATDGAPPVEEAAHQARLDAKLAQTSSVVVLPR